MPPRTAPGSSTGRRVEDQGELVKAMRPAGPQKNTPNLQTRPVQRKRHLARHPLHNLLSKYRVLNAISLLAPEVINNCLQSIQTEPPSRPLTDSLASVYINTPRSWLIIRGMIPNIHSDVLQAILEILSDAIMCTDHVLSHTLLHPTLTVIEQELTSAILFDNIRARRLVVGMLQRKIQGSVGNQVLRTGHAIEKTVAEAPLPSLYLEQVVYYGERPLPPLPAQKVRQDKATGLAQNPRVLSRKDVSFSPSQRFTALTEGKPAPAANVDVDVVACGSGKAAVNYNPPRGKLVHIVPVLVAWFLLLSFKSSSPGNFITTAAETLQSRYPFAPLLIILGAFAVIRQRSLWSAAERLAVMFRQCIPSSVATWILQFQATQDYVLLVLRPRDSIRIAISKVFRKAGLTDPHLEDGKVRVRWRCDCGRCLYDDFIELRLGAALELAQVLHGAIERAPTTDQGQPSSNASDCLSSSTVQNVTGFRDSSQAVAGTKLEQAGKAYDPRPKDEERAATVIDCTLESRWLLVCANAQKRPTSLSQLDICSTSTDKELFENLKRAYLKLKSRWSRWFSMKTVQSIRFVQFELHIRDFVDIRKVPDMPPDTRRDEYLY